MAKDSMVLCGANSYEEKYYLGESFRSLPQSVQDELKIMCVLFVHDVGGLFLIEYDAEGKLQFKTEAAEGDYTYDEIGAALKVKELQRKKEGLMRSLELYYQVVIDGAREIHV